MTGDMEESIKLNLVFEVAVQEISESFAVLRLINPRSIAAMTRSLRQYGQISPVVVGPRENGRHEMVDGFKRFHACRELGYGALKARVLPSGAHGLKAAIIHLNKTHGAIGDLEEALVVQSLYREDGLPQKEISLLLGRHKSWVSRRISLMERLSDEVLHHIRLGLIKVTVGRELSRLPRGNQEAALKTILKYHFTCRESARLAALLLSRPRWDHESILSFPEEILDGRCSPRPRNLKIPETVAGIMKALTRMKKQSRTILAKLGSDILVRLTEEQSRDILSLVGETAGSLAALSKMLEQRHEAALY